MNFWLSMLKILRMRTTALIMRVWRLQLRRGMGRCRGRKICLLHRFCNF